MKFAQRDLVWLKEKFTLPDGTSLDHPVLIISCQAANAKENYYTGVMMSATTYVDLFSFKLQNEMFESPLSKEGCQLRLYILVSIRENQIDRLANRMHKIHFKQVVKQISEYVICPDN